jgi:glycosyltransferase involved in cell wall biosynthesis
MNLESQPLVSIVTPVYNMGSFLPECIESVLTQTYKNFEYIIVNNCSTDRSLEVALSYAKQDSRVQVHTNDIFVGVIENHNIAFSRISPAAKYCKVVSADDWIFADCIMRMVECGETNPSVGIIGSYQLSGSHVLWQGFPYPKAVFSGHELCRQVFICDDKKFGFGSPTSLLYRADLVRNSKAFYPNASPHADTSACFNELRQSDFGFVYQVLSYERTHASTQSSISKDINRYSSANLNDLLQYGPLYLSKEEVDIKLSEALRGYYDYLAVSLIRFRGEQFWEYHRRRLQELGFPITPWKLLWAVLTKGLTELKNPVKAVSKVFGTAGK